MRQVRHYIIALGISCLASAAHGALLFQESFEGASQYTVQNGGYQDSTNDRFFAALPLSSITLGYDLRNIHGAGYFAARDLDGYGSSATPHRLIFATQDVAAYSKLSLDIALSANGDFEADDALVLEYSVDGGLSYQQLDRFAGGAPGLLTNGANALTQSLVDYSYDILMDPRTFTFRVSADKFIANNEIVALDNVRLYGELRPRLTATVPEPATAALLGLGALIAGLLSRRRLPRH